MVCRFELMVIGSVTSYDPWYSEHLRRGGSAIISSTIKMNIRGTIVVCHVRLKFYCSGALHYDFQYFTCDRRRRVRRSRLDSTFHRVLNL